MMYSYPITAQFVDETSDGEPRTNQIEAAD